MHPEIKQRRLNTIQDQIDSIECGHPKKVIRSKGPHFCFQCTRCGEMVGTWLRHDKVLSKDKVKPFDEDLIRKFRQTRHELNRALIDQKRKIEKDNFDEKYAEYLQSSEWHEKRRMVLSRCHGMCEGCGRAHATQVHHLTYNNLYHEFLFELVGLCKDCHSTIHDN